MNTCLFTLLSLLAIVVQPSTVNLLPMKLVYILYITSYARVAITGKTSAVRFTLHVNCLTVIHN